MLAGGAEEDAQMRGTVRLASYEGPDNERTATTQPASGPTTQPKKTEPRQRRRRRVVVKAVGVSGEQKTQVVLTREDAEKLRRSPEGASLLRAGRVVVVVDSAAAARICTAWIGMRP